ncbi:MAG: AI-2E family transporter [Polyangiaceae bacterium]
MKSQGAKDALVALASGGSGGASAETTRLPTSPEQIIALVREHGGQALDIVGGIAGAAANAALAFAIFFYAAYVFLVDGPEIYGWIERHAPFNEHATGRFAAAFEETGRGLIVGSGLTALVQAAISTITYFAVGVPRALVLGFVTFIAALLPPGHRSYGGQSRRASSSPGAARRRSFSRWSGSRWSAPSTTCCDRSSRGAGASSSRTSSSSSRCLEASRSSADGASCSGRSRCAFAKKRSS